MAYTDKQKEKIKKQFLDEYKKQRTISSAISGLKVNRDTIYEWFKQDPEFKQRFDEEKIYLQSNGGIPIDCFYHIYAERQDTERLIPEYEGTIEDYPGDNSQRSIVGYHYDKRGG